MPAAGLPAVRAEARRSARLANLRHRHGGAVTCDAGLSGRLTGRLEIDRPVLRVTGFIDCQAYLAGDLSGWYTFRYTKP